MAARRRETAEVDHRTVAGITLPVQHPSRVAGTTYSDEVVVARLRDVGCTVDGPDADGLISVTPPSWRPDLTDPNDFAEEVIRLEGYEKVPSGARSSPLAPDCATPHGASSLPSGEALAGAGWTEIRAIPSSDSRRSTRWVCPTTTYAASGTADQPALRRGAVPPADAARCGLSAALHRNLGRGLTDVAIFDLSPVFLAKPGAPMWPRDRR